MNELTPIPKLPFPEGRPTFHIQNDPLVSVEQILFEPRYAKAGFAGAIDKCYLRKEAYERLLRAQETLPEGCRFKIYDAWRPFSVQQALYAQYRAQVERAHPDADPERIEQLTQRFVSKPIKTPLEAPVHTTGGAVDLTIVDKNGQELDMGTEFDSFCDAAHTAYFEEAGRNAHVRENRRLLYHAMIAAGFTNLSAEWWHYDFGTRFWAYYTGKDALYTGIFEED